jgi:lipoprotein-anchoring transpeptidase ErfK/SrfK
MVKRWKTFLKTPWLVWPLIALLTLVDAAGIYMLVNSDQAEAAQAQVKAEKVEAARKIAAAKPPEPIAPPPPAMIDPLPVATALQSGTLIVISKKSQHMYVFHQGVPWSNSRISSGKRRHETPSGVFPILQKRKFHRSNIYSNAPMPFMQRLTWDGIALHAGRVPGYAASHGCIRMPIGFAEALFKLTNMSQTTVVVGDAPFENDVDAQQFALTTQLPIRSALAPPAALPPVAELAIAVSKNMRTAIINPQATAPTVVVAAPPPAIPASAIPAPTIPTSGSTPPVAPGTPTPAAQPITGPTIQLAAAASATEAEDHWQRLVTTHPDIKRFQKRVEPATVNNRQVYRLRISGPDVNGFCAKLKSEGLGCLNVS